MVGVSMSQLMNNISSYHTNLMLAAIISLLVVILFVLLLHIYAKWFLTLSRHTRTSTNVTISYALHPPAFHHFDSASPSEGLAPSLISSIPLFVYTKDEEETRKDDLECAVCLSVFEANEIGRRLMKCGHCFHVECIDMWLHSHLNCPVCRAPAASETKDRVKSLDEIVVIDVENIESGSVLSYDTSPTCSNSMVGCSDNLKRVLSRNRSEGCKVFASVNNDLGL